MRYPAGRGKSSISTHAPLARCDMASKLGDWIFPISTHAPLARCDMRYRIAITQEISTHAPLARCDTDRVATVVELENFNSRTSCEVRRCSGRRFRAGRPYFNSRTSCEVRPVHLVQRPGLLVVISTHAPLARCDVVSFSSSTLYCKFQLTHLLRGATVTFAAMCYPPKNFNSRTSCEVRRTAVPDSP